MDAHHDNESVGDHKKVKTTCKSVQAIEIEKVIEVSRTADVTTSKTFADLMLNTSSLDALGKAGFEKPSPIQVRAIPIGMLGFDMLVQAKSGTGKTMVFSLLALESLNAQLRYPQAIIVAPTREIAAQIVAFIRRLAPPVIQIGLFVGGNEKGVGEDIKNLKKGFHIVVGTIGRLCHLARMNVLQTDHVKMFVLDEADKLMEHIFQKDINYLFSSLPQEKQVMVFSATYPQQIASVLSRYMRSVHLIRLNADDVQLLGIKQYVVFADSWEEKINVLINILRLLHFNQSIIFAENITRYQMINEAIRSSGIDFESISGNMPQVDRFRVIKRLKNASVRILVSSDLISRGIDVENVNTVINMGIGCSLSTYFHRIGRAGRFGGHGVAISVIDSNRESFKFSKMVSRGNLRVKVLSLDKSWPNDLIQNEDFFNSSPNFEVGRAVRKHRLLSTSEEISINQVTSQKDEAKHSPFTYTKSEMLGILQEMGELIVPTHLPRSIMNAEAKRDAPTTVRKSSKNIQTKEIQKIEETMETCNSQTVNVEIKSTKEINEQETVKNSSDTLTRTTKNKFKFTALERRQHYLRGQMLSIRDAHSENKWFNYASTRYQLQNEPFLMPSLHKAKESTIDCDSIGNDDKIQWKAAAPAKETSQDKSPMFDPWMERVRLSDLIENQKSWIENDYDVVLDRFKNEFSIESSLRDPPLICNKQQPDEFYEKVRKTSKVITNNRLISHHENMLAARSVAECCTQTVVTNRCNTEVQTDAADSHIQESNLLNASDQSHSGYYPSSNVHFDCKTKNTEFTAIFRRYLEAKTILMYRHL